MATTPLKYLNQYITTTLSVVGGIDASQTTGIVIQSSTGLETTKAGVALLSYADPLNTTNAEWITYTAITANELQGVTRGAEGGSGKVHANGVTIAFPLSESHINNLNAMFDTTGLDIAQISTPANPDSGRNKLYFKTGGLVWLTSAGVETKIRSPRVYTTTSTATLTPEIDTYDEFALTALAEALTIANHSTSTPTNGDKILITITPDATPRAISFGTNYVAKAGVALPTTTTASKTMVMGFRWDSGLSKFNLLASGVES